MWSIAATTDDNVRSARAGQQNIVKKARPEEADPAR